MIRVLVVHSVKLFGSALAALLRAEGSFDVRVAPGLSGTGWGGGELPDVYVVDVECAGSATLMQDIASAAPGADHAPHKGALLVLVTADRPGMLRKAFDSRALGYVDKNNGAEGRLADAIRIVAKGERFVDESLAFGFLRASDVPLSARELTVLSLAAEGQSIGDMARGLRLSSGTVRNYMAAATRKVGARNRMDAVRISREAGWL
ncbi:response regulator transcription factor [Streptomyces tsukubensis]|uniref:HTH luxR-type domain-containing protein n=1 Tax=Streptomyces tsukubensis TaxID=83656 RepID=A0A1V4A9T7_9ACTN|nr:response regulator transcription factor [Streptomyces tsukubensis]OON80592.1 hypothetical protein B1H18_11940 [Streptomyces tsukubensis]QFR96245.1 DNA-binding response regulator [Streptomyces tsukubensis]